MRTSAFAAVVQLAIVVCLPCVLSYQCYDCETKSVAETRKINCGRLRSNCWMYDKSNNLGGQVLLCAKRATTDCNIVCEGLKSGNWADWKKCIQCCEDRFNSSNPVTVPTYPCYDCEMKKEGETQKLQCGQGSCMMYDRSSYLGGQVMTCKNTKAACNEFCEGVKRHSGLNEADWKKCVQCCKDRFNSSSSETPVTPVITVTKPVLSYQCYNCEMKKQGETQKLGCGQGSCMMFNKSDRRGQVLTCTSSKGGCDEFCEGLTGDNIKKCIQCCKDQYSSDVSDVDVTKPAVVMILLTTILAVSHSLMM